MVNRILFTLFCLEYTNTDITLVATGLANSVSLRAEKRKKEKELYNAMYFHPKHCIL